MFVSYFASQQPQINLQVITVILMLLDYDF